MMLLVDAIRRFYAVCKRHWCLILFILMVIVPIAMLLHRGTQMLYREHNVHIAISNYFYRPTTVKIDPPRRQIFEYDNGAKILSRKVEKFSNFIVELNNSEPHQFDSRVLNFTYKSDHKSDMQKTFLKEFSGYDSFPTNQTPSTYRGYIFAMGIGQELSQCTRLLLELCLYAGTSNRTVVPPRMMNGAMQLGGQPFGEFFNVSRLNKQLRRFGYSELATEKEFWNNCDGQRKKVLVVFYEKPFRKSAPLYFSPRDKFDLYDRVRKHRWLNCTEDIVRVAKMYEKYQNHSDFYCLDRESLADIKTVNEKILGDSKCVFINSFNELYHVKWNRHAPAGAPGAFKLLYWFLDPNLAVINEASVFREKRIERPYVAIHIRGAKFKNKSFLRPCFDIALEFVKALRRTRKVKTLFLSTDMSKFGGMTNKDKNSHELFAELSGAVIYDPKVANTLTEMDRWKVSLTEVRLLSQSDHLITIGQGSFGRFIRNRYLWEHRDKQDWTLTTLCMRTATRYH